MKILVLHSDIAPDAPPEEQDTLIAAEAVRAALNRRGYQVAKAAFHQQALTGLIEVEAPDLVFNLVEGVDGKGALAPLAPRLLASLRVPFTGADAEAMDLTNDKPKTKQKLRDTSLSTPDWSTPPDWSGLDGRKWIVKSSLEDGSIGLDDDCVVAGADAVKARAGNYCAARFAGHWFAEEYVEGREFNIALLGRAQALRILPMAEMTFADWPRGKPRIVGYGAKWDEESPGYRHTVRRFEVEKNEPQLAAKLKSACEKVWRLFHLRGFVRVDFRVRDNEPLILEINVNPCISPDAGFAAAAEAAGMAYDDLIEEIVKAAR